MEEQKTELKMIRMSEVESQEVKWLWYPFIPYGKLTIIQGDPGDGKTTLVLNIAAKYRMLKSITDKSDGKIVILDMICFEYLILAFDRLVELTGTGKTDKIKIRDKVLAAVENHRID